MTPSEARPIGLIGVGTMGGPMARRMAGAGHALVLHDADAQALARVAAEIGAQTAATPRAVAARCPVVILMLPDSAVVSQVIEAPQTGMLGALAAGQAAEALTVVDMGSSDPMETRRLGSLLAADGAVLLDAPVSGGLRKARAGTLAILLGGDSAQALDRVAPLLAPMGQVLRTGGLGSGHATKALNNYVSAAGLAAACEAVLVGRAFGLDPGTLIEAINASTGRNNSTETKMAQFVLSERFREAGFALDLMAKDVGLAARLGRELGQALPGLEAAQALWAAAAEDLGRGADHTEILRYLARQGRTGSA